VAADTVHRTFWGGYCGYFADPDGHLWEIVWNPQLIVADHAAPNFGAAANLRKHRVSFDEAMTVFADWQSITIADPEHSEGEQGF
jgi:hypothetical protein